MKKLIALMLAFGVTAGIAHAQTQVLSQNAVGYVKQEIEGGKLYLVSNPFVNLEEPDGHALVEMLDEVPNGTIVSVWDAVGQTYISYTKSARGVWDFDAQNAVIPPAEPMFLRIPAAADSAEIFFMGEVPSDEEIPQGRVTGLTFVGYPFPASVLFTNTAFATATPNSGVVSFWDPDLASYVSYTKSARGVWDFDAQTAVVSPGQAFIVRSSAAPSDWDEVKPYTWP